VGRRGWRFHHLGIPTDIPRPGERYLERLKIHVSGFETSPFGVEWMRFDPDCPVPELVRTVPHLAFEVDDLDAALEGEDILSPPDSPSKGVRAAMIVHDGAPIELIEFRRAAAVSESPEAARKGAAKMRPAVRNKGSPPKSRSGERRR
jgi:hypothetical protein